MAKASVFPLVQQSAEDKIKPFFSCGCPHHRYAEDNFVFEIYICATELRKNLEKDIGLIDIVPLKIKAQSIGKDKEFEFTVTVDITKVTMESVYSYCKEQIAQALVQIAATEKELFKNAGITTNN